MRQVTAASTPQEESSIRQQWLYLALFSLTFSALNEIAALAVIKTGILEILLDVAALLLGLFVQHVLFGTRFFITNEDRKLFQPRRYALVFGGAFKEGIKPLTFAQRAGLNFPYRVTGVVLGAILLAVVLVKLQWITFVILFNLISVISILNAFDFWRPLMWSAFFLVFNVISHYDSASGRALITMLAVGGEILFFAALQSHLEKQLQGRAIDTRQVEDLTSMRSWIVPLIVFCVATTLLYPLMPGKRSAPLPESHWAKRMAKGSGRSCNLPGKNNSSPSNNGSEVSGGGSVDGDGQSSGGGSGGRGGGGRGGGKGAQGGARNGAYAGTGEGHGGGEGASQGEGGSGSASRGGEANASQLAQGKLTKPESMSESQWKQALEELKHAQENTGANPSGNGGMKLGVESAQNPAEGELTLAEKDARMKKIVEFGNNAAEGIGKANGLGKFNSGQKETSRKPSSRSNEAKPPSPKLDVKSLLKRYLPIFLFAICFAGALYWFWHSPKKKPPTKKRTPRQITPEERMEALERLERQLTELQQRNELVSPERVVETYNLFLDFLKDHEVERPEYATPDEFAIDIGLLTQRSDMQPVTRIFCNTFYGKRSPTREEFIKYIDDIREVARAVHDAA